MSDHEEVIAARALELISSGYARRRCVFWAVVGLAVGATTAYLVAT